MNEWTKERKKESSRLQRTVGAQILFLTQTIRTFSPVNMCSLNKNTIYHVQELKY